MFEGIKKIFKGKQDDIIEPIIMRNRLMVMMMDGKEHKWTLSPWKGKNYIVPWVNFYQWYFKKDSDYYVMKYDKGETMIKRTDIKTFTVHTDHVNK